MKEVKCKDFKVMISITKRLQEIKMSFNNQASNLVLNEVNEEQKDFRGVKKPNEVKNTRLFHSSKS